MITVEQKLQQWMTERHLTEEGQRKGLVGNLLEEYTEFARATTDYERIDALCDICVFLINAGYKPHNDLHLFDNYIDNKKLLSSIMDICDGDMKLNKKLNNIHTQYIFDICNTLAYHMDYDLRDCLKETVLEISSRKGKYDDKLGKFVKDESDTAKRAWYKARYIPSPYIVCFKVINGLYGINEFSESYTFWKEEIPYISFAIDLFTDKANEAKELDKQLEKYNKSKNKKYILGIHDITDEYIFISFKDKK